MESFEEILTKLEKGTNVSRKGLMTRIAKKQQELSGLVSKEGAAHLVAKDLGLDLLGETRRRLEIKNIVSGMRNVNVVGRVFKISNVVEFKRQDGSAGRVVNIFLADNTGCIRLPLWDTQVKIVEDETVKVGDVIQVMSAFARENVFGDVEMNLGKYSSIQAVEEDMPSAEELNKKFMTNGIERTDIKNAMPGVSEMKATIVHVFKGNFLFDTCSICGSTLKSGECQEHGKVDAIPALVISCVADDGTGDLRAVLFRELAERVVKTSAEELKKLSPDERFGLIEKNLVGKDFVLTGRIKKDKVFDRIEMVVNDYKDLNVLNESKKLIEEIELRVG